ncbi:uncharacterized protein LOC127878033 isoform X1 [Dreissena polymorpha]|uniref:uncharacterized protein LOC127878033 isoform X1 n=2 Tax=Dreissena polymorpha TaxID=45954 RepID=UPI00226456BB|nr:uncharacterized protein LOC127878033 isoform X1 [Dreissena polymorpha]
MTLHEATFAHSVHRFQLYGIVCKMKIVWYTGIVCAALLVVAKVSSTNKPWYQVGNSVILICSRPADTGIVNVVLNNKTIGVITYSDENHCEVNGLLRNARLYNTTCVGKRDIQVTIFQVYRDLHNTTFHFRWQNGTTYVDMCKTLIYVYEPPPMPRINNKIHGDHWVSVPNVVTGFEGQRLYLDCSCYGGFPIVSAAWYLHQQQIASTLQTCDMTQKTGCYLKTEYTFKATLEDDNVAYLCHCWLSVGPEERQTTDIEIYLYTKPSMPVLKPVNYIIEGVPIVIGHCETSGFKPFHSFSLVMQFGNITHSYTGPANDPPTFSTFSASESFPEITPMRADNGKNLSCTVGHNALDGYLTSAFIINVLFKPLSATITGKNVIIANGNNTVKLTCTSGTANPVSDIQWSFDSIHSTPPEVKHELSEYGGKATLSTITLTPTRNDVGKNVTCTAVNEVNLVNPAISVVTLDLQFYPDVKVISQNTSSLAGETTLICNASGLPSTYIFSQVWTQEWPGYGRLRELTGTSSTLTLNQLTYEYSGVYSCSASNGILINDAGEYFALGSGYLLVKDAPVLTSPSVITGQPFRIAGKVGENISFAVDVYSNDGSVNTSVVSCINGTWGHSTPAIFETRPANVILPVFNHLIPVVGMRVNITVPIDNTSDFGDKEVEIRNKFGHKSFRIHIETQGPPEPPYNIAIQNDTGYAAHIKWQYGFHGGCPQTFVVQASIDGNIWTNLSNAIGGMEYIGTSGNTTIRGLLAGHLYMFRIFSYSILGQSKYSEVKYMTISILQDSNYSSIYGTIFKVVGPLVAVVVIGTVAVSIGLHIKRTRKGSGTVKEGNDDRSSEEQGVQMTEDTYETLSKL